MRFICYDSVSLWAILCCIQISDILAFGWDIWAGMQLVGTSCQAMMPWRPLTVLVVVLIQIDINVANWDCCETRCSREAWHDWRTQIKAQRIWEIVKWWDVILVVYFLFDHIELGMSLQLLQILMNIVHLVEDDWLCWLSTLAAQIQWLWRVGRLFWLLWWWHRLTWHVLLSWCILQLAAPSLRRPSVDISLYTRIVRSLWVVLGVQALVNCNSTNSFIYLLALLLTKSSVQIFTNGLILLR